ncbi:Cell surface proteoglycan [Sparganum proliferum]
MSIRTPLFIVTSILVLLCARNVCPLDGPTNFAHEYGTSFLERIGCARARRLFLLRTNQTFPGPPYAISPILIESLRSSDRKDVGVDGARSRLITQSGSPLPKYLPTCRSDRPDLYTARQCSERDCFCVNVTTGVPFAGTWTSPDELRDCNTAVFTIDLAIYQNEPFSDKTVHQSVRSSSEASYWEPRIARSIEELCRSAPGYQRVASIRQESIEAAQLSQPQFMRRPKFPDDLSRLVKFKVKLLSTGHGQTLQDTKELIQNRLEEGYLSGVGSVEPTFSSIEQSQYHMPDPQPVFSTDSDFETLGLSKEGSMDSLECLDAQDCQTDFGDGPVLSSMDTEKGKALEEQDGEAPSGSMQLDANSPEVDRALDGFKSRPISARQTAGDLASQNIWRRKSLSEILTQPGVIAGIVGSTIAGVFLLILLILFCIYRLRKRDEGSYSLDEPKKSPSASNSYTQAPDREFYA